MLCPTIYALVNTTITHIICTPLTVPSEHSNVVKLKFNSNSVVLVQNQIYSKCESLQIDGKGMLPQDSLRHFSVLDPNYCFYEILVLLLTSRSVMCECATSVAM